MHLTADPLLLLTALAFLIPWARLGAGVRRSYFAVRLALLRRRMGRDLNTLLLVLAGPIERYNTFKLVKAVYNADAHEHITVVLDTGGGELAAGLQLQHALASHTGRVTAVVPDEAWSSGTIIALAADEILMAPSANLGACDGILHVEPAALLAGPTVTSATTGESVELVRSRCNLRSVMAAIKEARIARGQEPWAAHALAERMVSDDTDHFNPLFPEQAQRLGAPVMVMPMSDVRRWWRLIYYAARA